MARPTKLNAEIQKRITDTIRAGNYIETAAVFAGISKPALYDWLKRGARERARRAKGEPANRAEGKFLRFSNAVEEAQAEAEIRDVFSITNAAKDNWQAAAWRLERKFPDRWGRKKLDIEHSGAVDTGTGQLALILQQLKEDDTGAEIDEIAEENNDNTAEE